MRSSHNSTAHVYYFVYEIAQETQSLFIFKYTRGAKMETKRGTPIKHYRSIRSPEGEILNPKQVYFFILLFPLQTAISLHEHLSLHLSWRATSSPSSDGQIIQKRRFLTCQETISHLLTSTDFQSSIVGYWA